MAFPAKLSFCRIIFCLGSFGGFGPLSNEPALKQDGLKFGMLIRSSTAFQSHQNERGVTFQFMKIFSTKLLYYLGRNQNCKTLVSLKCCWRLIYLYEPGHEKTCLMPYANNKGADQPAHPRSLISAFVVRCLDSMISLDSIAEISRL